MSKVVTTVKPVATNPLKLSQPLGASLAFLGIKGAIPLLHGSQGCTAFAKVMLVRHFRESVPLATTALTEVSTILGGEENIKKSIEVLLEKAKPQLIGLCSTALSEVRGEDVAGILKTCNFPIPVLYVSTPDFCGSLSDGYSRVVEAIVKTLPQAGALNPRQVTLLLGSDLTPGEVADLKQLVAAMGLTPIAIPDLSTSMDGHLADSYQGVSTGGVTVEEIQQAGRSAFVLAIGETMRQAAKLWQERFQVPYALFAGVTGLEATDRLIHCLMTWSGNTVPELYRWQRRQLLDALLDTHFYITGKRIALALEPNQLSVMSHFLAGMGAEIQVAVSPTRTPQLEHIPAATVIVGDLGDLQAHGAGADLLITSSRGVPIAKALGIPLLRMGFPIFDRLGNGLRSYVGYRGTMQLLFDISNLFLEAEGH
ncbi:MAG: nitrogenase iron-molybdenum cofactor biosynthesis protein NifN [Pseudanabaenaceae cyanobacterium SKYGB_i_bin29]|nr:nitrogenase iron-molybdenum cofactor biosynthesis protein NifN [Pseudanabaenaceae cyanobacterium SKYG29]MDW8422233.1 nitrogenase iron-molybdenum cofactor biosynthesis protein NifN [Pseudanabaenaceae cyanobacterium SKYGB_i_bin29]